MRQRTSKVRSVHELTLEREDLLRSLADLEAEFAAGDIDQADYTNLRSDYVARVAAILRQIENHDEVPEPPELNKVNKIRRIRRALGKRGTRRALAMLLALWLLLGVTYISLHFAGVRLLGESETGTVSLSTALVVQQDLEQASLYASSGDISESIELYNAVLAKVADQHEALTYQGWLIRVSGLAAHSRNLVSQGDQELSHAVSVAPGYPDARGFYGVALGVDKHDPTGAITQFSAFHVDQPSATLLSALGPQIAAIYREAHQALPAWIVKYSTTTSTTPTN